MTTRARTVWVPDDPQEVGLDAAALSVDLRRYAPEAPPGDVRRGELLVLPYSRRDAARATLSRLPAGSIAQALEAGVDGLLPALGPDVTLCNARGVHDGPVAEWVLAAILASLKRLGEFRDAQRDGEWRRTMPDQLAGRHAMILGYGSIGRAVEQRLVPFGVTVTRVARSEAQGAVTLDTAVRLLGQVDVVIVLLPLTPATAGVVDATFLAAMRPGALLVNASRGPVVDTGALVEALRSGRVRAALDVTDPEPLPPDHPLWSTPNLLLTPHVASDEPDVRRRAYELVREQIERLTSGRDLLNVVRGEY